MIKNAILQGKNELLKTIETYESYLKKQTELLESIKVANNLMDNELKVKQANAERKTEAIKSRISYINFIIKEIDGIKNLALIDEKPDFVNHCIYFGNGTLYYSDKLLEMPSQEIFDTILNHIIYYTGALYIPNNKEIILSYITTSISILYNIKIDFKLGRSIYKKYNKTIGHKILDISNKSFFIRNNSKLGFFNWSITHGYYITYRILLGNKIELRNMRLKINDIESANISISDMSSGYSFLNREDRDRLFKMA